MHASATPAATPSTRRHVLPDRAFSAQDIKMAGFVFAVICCAALLLAACAALAYLFSFVRAWRSYRRDGNSNAAERELLSTQPTLLKGLWGAMLVLG